MVTHVLEKCHKPVHILRLLAYQDKLKFYFTTLPSYEKRVEYSHGVKPFNDRLRRPVMGIYILLGARDEVKAQRLFMYLSAAIHVLQNGKNCFI